MMIESFREHLILLFKKAVKIRMDALKLMNKAGSGHVGGSMSAVELMVSLYYGKISSGSVLNYDVTKPGFEGQDYFVLSKAHASPVLYSILADVGFFDASELDYFRQINSMLSAFPNKKIPGVFVSTGAPAVGLSAAAGLAMSLKMDRLPNRVYCLMGEGELQDGLSFEVLMSASHYKLDNLVVLLDCNGLQAEGTVRSVMNVEPYADKFQYFGWKTVLVNDGHDFDEILSALERASEVQRRPTVIIAKTVKGKGVVFAENKPFYHSEVLSDQEILEVMPKLEYQLDELNKL